ncbi:MAG: deoxyhypusine synthase family protein [Candidatus Margulisbacteria bacterium]|nr:deoxyhypusine synthase family protein [Candidatus Margulisiibacteriota bacterium]
MLLKNKKLKKEKKGFLKEKINQIKITEKTNLANLLEEYKGASIQARNLGLCADVLERMLKDKERPTILLGLAGPLIAAGLRAVIAGIIKHNLVDVIVSTGAILYQDVYQARGFQHYKGSAKADDKKLADLYINRIYDTYIDEEKFWQTDCAIGRFTDSLEPRQYSSREYLELMGKQFVKDPHSIVRLAALKGIPVFSPALNDSSIGIGLTEHYHRAKKDGRQQLSIDSVRDNYELAQIVAKSKATAAIYIAGGVPKNYINDAVVMTYIFDIKEMHKHGHKYAVQVTTDAPHWGGLSGSTLQEAMSWGKISKQATTAMAFIEPSVSLPILYGYALQKNLHKGRRSKCFKWNKDILEEIA